MKLINIDTDNKTFSIEGNTTVKELVEIIAKFDLDDYSIAPVIKTIEKVVEKENKFPQPSRTPFWYQTE